ncbi:MAG: molybdate ABC transporter substrate-binding protein [Acidobacteriota bacterium]|nr:molybdate ABC transporter substrate-binding protein [Acidobacteriota bacterium]
MTLRSARASVMGVVTWGLVLTLGCAPADDRDVVAVSVAASLSPAFTEIVESYERRHPERSVRINTAASGILARQIEQGVPADLFLSASPVEVDRLNKRGALDSDSITPIAFGSMVVVVRLGSTPPETLGDLANPAIERIAIGNPETVPQGRYAREALIRAGIWERVHDRLILGESAHQVLNYVVGGEVDAALVYKSDTAGLLTWAPFAVPGPEVETDSPVTYVGAVPRDAERPDLGREVLAFVMSPDGQAILDRFGFLPPEP